MTTLYLDCEFNGHYGKFISMALYNPTGISFYQVCHDWEVLIKRGELTEFVVQNVIPNLQMKGLSHQYIVANLTSYLSKFEDEIIIIADWPEDFVHLCNLLFRPAFGTQVMPSKIIPNLTMKLVTTGDKFKSEKPHNAMDDAIALCANYQELMK